MDLSSAPVIFHHFSSAKLLRPALRFKFPIPQQTSIAYPRPRFLLMASQSQHISCASPPGENGCPTIASSPIDSGSSTGIPFLDHMLDQLASHGLFDVHVRATGDTHMDDHHTNEDVALAIGTALLTALGERKGINRFGDFTAPLDEALIHVSLVIITICELPSSLVSSLMEISQDLSGRPYLGYNLEIPTQRVGTYDTQLVEHFFQSLVNTSGMTLHIRQLAGKNSHHIIEATFKAFARALRQATESDPRRGGKVPSSKGVLSRS